MENDRETVADAMNRALFLSPDLVGEGEEDPLLQQALQNVDDTVDEAKARAAAEAISAARERTQTTRKTGEVRAPLSDAEELREIVGTLVPLVGRKYTALIGGARGTGAIAEWVRGASVPENERMARLRLTYRLTETLRARLDDRAAREWFLSRNQLLDGERPIALVALQPISTIQDRLLAAAAAAAAG